jgi:hypothetical protein
MSVRKSSCSWGRNLNISSRLLRTNPLCAPCKLKPYVRGHEHAPGKQPIKMVYVNQWDGSKTRDENDFLAKWDHVRARGGVGV